MKVKKNSLNTQTTKTSSTQDKKWNFGFPRIYCKYI